MQTSWNLLYGSTFQSARSALKSNSNALNTGVGQFNQLSFYESSFHFFLHRLQYFNSLSTNRITTSLIPDLKTPTRDNSLNLYTFKLLSQVLTAKSELSNNYLINYNNLVKDTNTISESSCLNNSKKDAVIVRVDRDF